MPLSGNPLLDQYNRDGIVTPQLQGVMDRVKQKLTPLAAPDPVQNGTGAVPNAPTPTLGTPQPTAPALAPQTGSEPLVGGQTHTVAPTPALAPPSPNQERLNHLTSTGNPIDSIHHAAGRIPLQILDALGSAFLPRLTEALPGTSLHHEMLVRHAQGNVAAEDKSQQEQAMTAHARAQVPLVEAQTEEAKAKPELEAAKGQLASMKQREVENFHNKSLEQKGEQETGRNSRADSTREAQLRQHGLKTDPVTGEIAPVSYEEMSPNEQAGHDLKASQTELADATTQLREAQAKNQPELVKLAQQRVINARQTSQIALQRLGLSEKQFEMHAHGTEGGVPLPGSMTTDTGQSVGTAFQQNVRPTGTQRDAAGRADTMLDLDSRIRKALQNPEISKGTGPLAGRLSEIENRVGVLPHDLAELKNDLISYGAFQAGLHPVRGIGALQYFDKVMGGLGQEPGELLGKLDSNKATASSVKSVGTPKTAGSVPRGTSAQIPTVTNKADFDKLPSGAEFMEDGNKYKKP